VRNEDALQTEVAKWLAANMPSASWFTATANGAYLGGDKRRRMIQSARLKRTGVKNGTPDIIICHDGRFLSIEMKCEGETLSDVQMEVEDAIAIAGGGYAVCRSLADVVETLSCWQVPFRGSHQVQG
jgi:hypothetical protein